MTNLNIKLHHGLVNSTPKQRAAAQTLGLNKIGKTGPSWPAAGPPSPDHRRGG